MLANGISRPEMVSQRPDATPATTRRSVVFSPLTFSNVASDIAIALTTLGNRERPGAAWQLDCATSLKSLLNGSASAVVLQQQELTHVEGSAAADIVDELYASYFPADGRPPAGTWARLSRARRLTHDPECAADSLGVTVALPGGGALSILVTYDHVLSTDDVASKRALLEIVRPVLASTAEARFPTLELQPTGIPASFARLLSMLGDGVLVYRDDGAELWRNRSLSLLLEGDDGSYRLLDAAVQLARGLRNRRGNPGATPTRVMEDAELVAAPATKQITTRRLTYHLNATYVAEYRAVVVTIGPEGTAERSMAGTIAALRARYRLTRRELDVTQLLMLGKSNQVIASELNVSSHTARHHTERVMEKLGVHSRAAIALVVNAE